MTGERPGAILSAMRTVFKSIVLALALAFTVSAGSLIAQINWQPVAVQKVPANVMTGYKKLFQRSKITKAETTGTGATALYRFTIQRNGKTSVVTFDATGQPQR